MEGGLITGVFLKKIFFSLVDESSINLLAKVYILYDGLLLVVIKRSLKYCEQHFEVHTFSAIGFGLWCLTPLSTIF
jgi:hypothetical protein